VPDPECSVLVLSVKASASGLSLTMATDMFVLEPALNPVLTQQALSRVHRLGQTKSVRCHHLVMENSVEEKILAATKAAIEAPASEDEATASLRSQRAVKDSLELRAQDLAAIFE
jgi:SNF2 family DNA or RNA helicase